MVQQSIKEINQSLVDDNLVCSDKIGSANFYWSFPKKAIQDQIVLNGSLHDQLTKLKAGIDASEKDIIEAKTNRSMSGRFEKLARLQELLDEEKDLDAKIELYKFNDPVEIDKISQASELNKVAANRWTDNIFIIKSFLVKKKGMASKEADKIIKIDSSFDYVA